MNNSPAHHLTPSPESIGAFIQRGVTGPVTMLNLMRFRDVADYNAAPGTDPGGAITGRSAYDEYLAATAPLFAQAGAEVILRAQAGTFLVGPLDEHWDAALVIRFPSVGAFVTMTNGPQYAQAAVHRSAALVDSRILPLVEGTYGHGPG